jgi:hypothetical protein
LDGFWEFLGEIKKLFKIHLAEFELIGKGDFTP